jgi:hypothetical protein
MSHLNREKLKEASNHLWYEIWMFQELVKGPSSTDSNQIISNALLESFAIHVRALIHFFFDKSGQKDDILALHFFSSPDDWIDQAPPYTDTLKEAKKRADKEVAHLTYTRQKVTPDKKPWQLTPIANDLQHAIEKFFELVPKELLGNRWDQTIKQSQSGNIKT